MEADKSALQLYEPSGHNPSGAIMILSHHTGMQSQLIIIGICCLHACGGRL